MCREDFLNAMVKLLPDFFKDESKPSKKIKLRSEELSMEREERFLGAKCNTYELPYFDIPQSEYDI